MKHIDSNFSVKQNVIFGVHKKKLLMSLPYYCEHLLRSKKKNASFSCLFFRYQLCARWVWSFTWAPISRLTRSTSFSLLTVCPLKRKCPCASILKPFCDWNHLRSDSQAGHALIKINDTLSPNIDTSTLLWAYKLMGRGWMGEMGGRKGGGKLWAPIHSMMHSLAASSLRMQLVSSQLNILLPMRMS